MIIIKILLKLPIVLGVFITLFISIEIFSLRNYKSISYNSPSSEQFTINEEANKNTSNFSKYIATSLASDKFDHKYNRNSHSNEVERLLQNAYKCMRSKFQIIR